MTVGRAARGTAAAVLLALTPACTHHGKQAASTTTATTAGSTSSSASTTTTSATSTTPSTATAPAVPRCTAAHLRLGHDQGGVAAGSTYYHLSLTNRGAQPCSLKGYPGFQLVDSAGRPVATTVQRGSISNSGPPGVVVIPPGGEAWFGLEAGHVCTDTAQPFTSSAALVIPPDETHQLRTDLSVAYCKNPQVLVTAVRQRQEDV